MSFLNKIDSETDTESTEKRFWTRVSLNTLGLVEILGGFIFMFIEYQSSALYCLKCELIQPTSCRCVSVSSFPIILSCIFPLIGFLSIFLSMHKSKFLTILCGISCGLGFVSGAILLMGGCYNLQNSIKTVSVQSEVIWLAVVCLNILVTTLISPIIFHAKARVNF